MNYDYDLKCEVLNLSRLFGNWMMIGSYTSLFGVKQPIVLIYKFLRLRQSLGKLIRSLIYRPDLIRGETETRGTRNRQLRQVIKGHPVTLFTRRKV